MLKVYFIEAENKAIKKIVIHAAVYNRCVTIFLSWQALVTQST